MTISIFGQEGRESGFAQQTNQLAYVFKVLLGASSRPIQATGGSISHGKFLTNSNLLSDIEEHPKMLASWSNLWQNYSARFWDRNKRLVSNHDLNGSSMRSVACGATISDAYILVFVLGQYTYRRWPLMQFKSFRMVTDMTHVLQSQSCDPLASLSRRDPS